ncbi:MAG: gliding motility protein GldM [Bacteroidetes bacterium]|nr:gliding motility protein GldM [Bacteroidota bacterium]
MSLPKEPRQKMINMMYLVLTAMLALNVSAEVLNAFKVVNGSLQTSNDGLATQNKQIMADIAAKAAANESKEKAAIWQPQAQKAATYSKTLYDYIEALKDQLKREAGYNPEKGDTAFRIDDLDAATRLMGSEEKMGKGEELHQKLIEYKKDLFAISPDIAKEFANKLPLHIDPPKSEEGNTNLSWSDSYFHMTPAIAALTILGKFQNDVKNTENDVITYCHDQIGAVAVRYDKTGIISGANSTYLMPGEKLTVYAGVGAFSSAAQPTITIGGRPVSVDAEGKATSDIIVGGSGAQSVKINVTYKDQDGKVHQETKDISYTVGTPSGVAVSADKMNVLYIMGSTPNPVTISAGTGSDRVSATLTGGEMRHVAGSAWEAFPKTPGEQTINVIVEGKSTPKKFRVKYLPNPAAFVGAKKGGAISSAEFKAIGGLITRLEESEFEAPFKVISYKLGAIGGGISQYAQAVNEGNRWTGAAKAIVERATPGTNVFFDEIRVVGPDGRTREISPIFFSLK